MKRRYSLLALVVCAAVSVAGCKETTTDHNNSNLNNNITHPSNSEENEDQCHLDVLQPLAYGNVQGLRLEPGSTIAVIGRGSSSAYWSEVKRGAQRAIDDMNAMLGYKGEDKIKLTYSAPETEDDVDDQVNILDEELARYPAAVGIAAVDSGACEVQFDLAAENDIPVVAFDSGTDYQNIVSMVDTNNKEAAGTAANKLCDSIDDEGEILMFVHDSKSTSAKQREDGFKSVIEAKHPNVTIGEIYHLDSLEDMQKKIAEERAAAEGTAQEPEGDQQENPGADISQEEVIKYILEKHPEAKGIYLTNETCSKLVTAALEELGREGLKLVGFDGGKDQLKLVEEGRMEGLIVQNPFGIGYATVVACGRAVLGQGNEAVVDAGYTWVTKNNMNDTAIARMMY